MTKFRRLTKGDIATISDAIADPECRTLAEAAQRVGMDPSGIRERSARSGTDKRCDITRARTNPADKPTISKTKSPIRHRALSLIWWSRGESNPGPKNTP